MASLLDYLICKCSGLGLDAQNPSQNSAMVAHTCNSRNDIAETGGAPEQSGTQYSQSVRSRISEDPVSKIKVESDRERTQCTSPASSFVHTYTGIDAHVHTQKVHTHKQERSVRL